MKDPSEESPGTAPFHVPSFPAFGFVEKIVEVFDYPPPPLHFSKPSSPGTLQLMVII